MKITEITDREENEFNSLAMEHGSVFFTREWLGIFGGDITRYGIYSKKDELIGGFCTYREKVLGLSFYRNPPCMPTIGPFIKVDSKKTVTMMDNWKRVLHLMADFFNSLPYAVCSFSLDKCVVDTQPFYWNGYKVIPGYTYVLDVSNTEESIWKGFSTYHRNHVKKALKDGLIVKQISDLKIVEQLVLKSFSRQNKKLQDYYISKILFEYASESNCFAYATFLNDNAIACAFCIFDKNTAYYLLGGYDHENKHHGAGCMAVWETIKHSKSIGLKHYDFEGSMVPQIEKYFRGFGGQLTPYYTINKAKLPLEIMLKFFKRSLF